MAELGGPQIALEFLHQLDLRVAILERGSWRQEIARIGEAVGAYGSKLGQAESGAVILADIAPRLAVRQIDAELDAARHDRDLAGRRFERAKLGAQKNAALLRHEQKLAVAIGEVALAHRAAGEIAMDGDADARRGVAVAGHA